MANNTLANIPNNCRLLRLFYNYKGVIGIEYFSYDRPCGHIDNMTDFGLLREQLAFLFF